MEKFIRLLTIEIMEILNFTLTPVRASTKIAHNYI